MSARTGATRPGSVGQLADPIAIDQWRVALPAAERHRLCVMNTLVAEYRALPPSSDHLPDAGPNDRKCEIIRELDGQANDAEVSELLLDVLRDGAEFDLARVEAIQVVGIYVEDGNPLSGQLRAELVRIASGDDDDMLQGWARRHVELPPASPPPGDDV